MPFLTMVEPLASWSSPEATSTLATASVTVPKPVPSASAVAIALAADRLVVDTCCLNEATSPADGCRHRLLLSSPLLSTSIFLH